jgi:hypothetical protein
MRKFIYGNMVGMTCLAVLTWYLHKPKTITFDDKVSALALVLDGEVLKRPNRSVSAPIPQHKPDQGYTLAYRQEMDDLIKEYVSE